MVVNVMEYYAAVNESCILSAVRQFIEEARQDQECPILVQHPHEVNQVRDSHYTLFGPTSSNFLIGERLLANLHLPARREGDSCLPSRRTECR